MDRGDLLLAVGVPLAFVAAAGAYIWWDANRVEFHDERVVLCTVTELVHSDVTHDGYAETVQCGTLPFRPYGTRLEQEIEPGRTYRLRIAEFVPGSVTGIVAVEGELQGTR